MSERKENRAFEILAQENSRMLIAYLRCIVHNEAAIDDLFQETMVVAWRRLDDCDLSRPFGPWLRGIASKLTMAYHRKQKRTPISMDETVLAHLDSNFEAVSSRPGDTWDDKLEGLDECVEKLPTEYHEIIHLRYHREESVVRMAELLKIPLETCKKRLQRARLRIADCLRSKGFIVGELAS